MAELPPVETVDNALRRASQDLDALKRAKPANAAEARVRAAELMRTQQDLIDAARAATDAAVAKKFANGGAKTGGMYGLTEKQVEGIIEIMAHCVASHFDAFNKRLDELEARPAMKYEGVWDAEKVYSVGSFTTEDGSLWHSQLDSNRGVRPGSNPDVWRLAVKRGRNARDSR